MLVRDLFKAEFGWKMEMFGRGPDGGVDLRTLIDGIKIVAQCKHYYGSTFHDLRRSVTAEREKIARENPDRYLLVTSQDLSRTQKDALLEILRPWLKASADLLCFSDLNALIDSYPWVEENNFKLWLSSTTVLERIVTRGLWMRSVALMDEIRLKARLYVPTSHYDLACKLLSRDHIVVIIGAPGVGNSMLASVLALRFCEQQWQIIDIPSHRVDEYWSVYRDGTKQLFLFDDVFGQSDISDSIGRGVGSALSRLIGRIQRSSSKRLIITTRLNTLRDAQRRDEVVARGRFEDRACVIELSDFKIVDRGKLLYNHLYFSELDRQVVREFAEHDWYWSIIKHPNFNPRIVEQVLAHEYPRDAGRLSSRLQQTFDRPTMLWGPMFTEVFSNMARRILLHLVMFPAIQVPMQRLRAAAMVNAEPIDFTRAIKQVEGTFLRVMTEHHINPGTYVQFQNGSCRDFILSFLNSEPDYMNHILINLGDVTQLAQMLMYCIGKNELNDYEFPALWEWAMTNRSRIAKIINEKPVSAEAIFDPSYYLDTLIVLRRASAELNLEISAWIDDHTYLYGSELGRNQVPNGSSMEVLMHDLIDHNRVPRNEEERELLVGAFTTWVHCNGDFESKLAEAERFISRSRQVQGFAEVADRLQEAMTEGVIGSCEDEIGQIRVYSSSYDEAASWLGDVKRLAQRFGILEFLLPKIDREEADLREDQFLFTSARLEGIKDVVHPLEESISDSQPARSEGSAPNKQFRTEDTLAYITSLFEQLR